MIGKKNIVFGFLFLVFTASIGPYIALNMMPALSSAGEQKRAAFGELQKLVAAKFKDEIEDTEMPAAKIQVLLGKALLAVNAPLNERDSINRVKDVHVHGNLESVLNILAGIVLCFMAAPVFFKQLISWLFITGTLLHSGMAYLARAPFLEMSWAQTVLGYGVGQLMILSALLLAAIASIIWLKPEIVRD